MKLCRSAVVMAVVGTAALPVAACLNDRDSDALVLQAQRLPETVRVLTGRFERNPPLYYQMRVARVTKEIQRNPQRWELYDDVAVALDRLHRSDEAMKWMRAKYAQLPPYDAKNPKVKEAWYRYYANDGTFRAHRWLKSGAKMENLTALAEAQAEIKKAIEIKPDAHFGRERYQLMVMQWLYQVKTGATKLDLAAYLEEQDEWEDTEFPRAPHPNRDRAAEGLTGLIVLGAAWESVDVFRALAHALDHKEGAGLSYLALLREDELLSRGKKSFAPPTDSDVGAPVSSPGMPGFEFAVHPNNIGSLKELFPKLRVEADTWVSKRAAFMNERMRLGRHPDTDKKFWDGYVPAQAPSLDIAWYSQRERGYIGGPPRRNWYAVAVGVATVLGAGLVSLVLVRGRRVRLG